MFSFPQGVRMGETSTNVVNVNMLLGFKIHVEDGCDLADPCDSNICPENSHCSDDWSTHTCICDPGNTHSYARTGVHTHTHTHCSRHTHTCVCDPGYTHAVSTHGVHTHTPLHLVTPFTCSEKGSP